MGELEDALCGSSGKWVPHERSLPEFAKNLIAINRKLFCFSSIKGLKLTRC